ncbi:MAG TPA: NnrS family protein [Xanthobacteraceae bacterium]|nr:NnrS family protein [Xanthobacteraceae bacterium]
MVAALARIAAALATAWAAPLLELAALAWAGAFLGFAISYGPLLWRRPRQPRQAVA